jgi:arginyl-tRNA synthetase
MKIAYNLFFKFNIFYKKTIVCGRKNPMRKLFNILKVPVANGIYLLKVKTKDKVITKKIAVIR